MAIQRPQRSNQAWLRIWTDKAIVSSSSSQREREGQPPPAAANHDDGPELLSKERLAEESMGRLLAMQAELDVLFQSLAKAVPPPDAESVEAVDEARREVVVAAWRRRASEPAGGCWCVRMQCRWRRLPRQSQSNVSNSHTLTHTPGPAPAAPVPGTGSARWARLWTAATTPSRPSTRWCVRAQILLCQSLQSSLSTNQFHSPLFPPGRS